MASLGVFDFGENRVQELVEKLPAPAGASYHFIGQLQTNKVNKVVGEVEAIHSVDRVELLEKIARRAEQLGGSQKIFLQLNVTDEVQKGGAPPAELAELSERANDLESVELLGLMAMGRAGDDERTTRAAFARLRELSGETAGAGRALSMGMSDDFEWAIEEGATHVRVGSALFGPRP